MNATQTYLNESEQWQSNLTAVSWSSSVFGDIDNDGDSDLVAIGYGVSYSSKIYLNNGTTLTENSTWQQNLTQVHDGSLAFGDIDNDGDLDLVLMGCGDGGGGGINYCNSGGHVTKIYINNGTSLVESSQWQSNLTKLHYSSSTFGDIDNDGDLDLITTGRDSDNSKRTLVYLNNGTTLTESSQWQSNLVNVIGGCIAFGDIDNDGDLDLGLCGDITAVPYRTTKIYLNNGTSFVEDSTWEGDLTSVGDCQLSFSDFDNDGDLDINLIGCCDKHISYKNNGSTFSEFQTYSVVGGPFGGIYDGSISMGDYDNDGDLDIISSGNEKYTTVYLNNGSGNYTDYSLDPESHILNLWYDPSVIWIDLDNDKDLDLFLIGYDGSEAQAKVYLSNRSLTKNNTQPSASNSSFSSDYTNNVLTIGWGNGSDNETPTAGLYYNLMVGNSTTNHTIVSGVYGGSSNPTAGYFGNMMQRKNISLNLELEANETYYWYVQTIDTGLAKSNWSAPQNFTTGLGVSKPTITINSPSPNAGSHTTNASFIFNATITDANLTNVTLYADFNGTMIANETNSSGLNGTYIFTKNLTNHNDNVYSWYIYVCDSDSNCQTSGTRIFYLDRTYPIVNSISPSNGASSSSASVTFSYNVTDTDIANCSLIIGGSIDQTNTSVSEDTTQTFTKTMSNGNYNWNVNCTDYVGYTNSSSSRSLTVSVSSGNGGNGGGGGGGSSTTTPTTVTPTPKEFDVDFSTASTGTIEAKQGDVKTFSFQGEIKHSITTLTITNNSITLLITSDTITIQIKTGETKQIDMNSDGVNDIEIKLVSIIEGVADLLLTKLEGADIVAQEELEKEALFDVKVSISNLFKIIKSGRNVIAEIEVFNVNNIGQVDVTVDYYLTSKEDNQTKLAQGSDTLAVEAVTSFVRSLGIPYDSKAGKYLFNVDVKYNDKIMASSSTEFRIIRNYEIIIAVGIIVLIIVGIFFYLWGIKRKEEKLEKEVKKLKRKPWKIWRRKKWHTN